MKNVYKKSDNSNLKFQQKNTNIKNLPIQNSVNEKGDNSIMLSNMQSVTNSLQSSDKPLNNQLNSKGVLKFSLPKQKTSEIPPRNTSPVRKLPFPIPSRSISPTLRKSGINQRVMNYETPDNTDIDSSENDLINQNSTGVNYKKTVTFSPLKPQTFPPSPKETAISDETIPRPFSPSKMGFINRPNTGISLTTMRRKKIEEQKLEKERQQELKEEEHKRKLSKKNTEILQQKQLREFEQALLSVPEQDRSKLRDYANELGIDIVLKLINLPPSSSSPLRSSFSTNLGSGNNNNIVSGKLVPFYKGVLADQTVSSPSVLSPSSSSSSSSFPSPSSPSSSSSSSLSSPSSSLTALPDLDTSQLSLNPNAEKRKIEFPGER
jgi:hypothetical protein